MFIVFGQRASVRWPAVTSFIKRSSMQTRRNLPSMPLGLALAAAFLLAACGGKDQPPGAGAPGAPAVTVLTVKAEPVPLATELPGRTAPYLIAEVRPQVTGIIKARPFKEGSEG